MLRALPLNPPVIESRCSSACVSIPSAVRPTSRTGPPASERPGDVKSSQIKPNQGRKLFSGRQRGGFRRVRPPPLILRFVLCTLCLSPSLPPPLHEQVENCKLCSTPHKSPLILNAFHLRLHPNLARSAYKKFHRAPRPSPSSPNQPAPCRAFCPESRTCNPEHETKTVNFVPLEPRPSQRHRPSITSPPSRPRCSPPPSPALISPRQSPASC